MIENEVQLFAQRIGVDIPVFDARNPIRFKVDNNLDFCLEFRNSGDLISDDGTVSVPNDLILSLIVPLAPYDRDSLLNYLKHSSIESLNSIRYTVGFAKDNLMLMTDIPYSAQATDIENAILMLKRQYEEVSRNG